MSIVIPSGHLARTVITVRCNSPQSAPHIECALDEQTPFGSTQELLGSPRMFTTDGRTTASSSTVSMPPSGPVNIPQADLSVERGIDHRGHYVRLSFLPGHRSSHNFSQRPFEAADAPYFPLGNHLSGPSSSIGSREASVFRPPAFNPPHTTGGSPLAYSSVPIMNGAHAEAATGGLDNMNFMSSADADLITALDSFMGIFNPPNTDYPMIDVGGQGNIVSSQQSRQISEPASPDMSSSSSLSSCSNSPTTPYNFFLPATMPTTDGGRENDTEVVDNGKIIETVSEQSYQSSPVLPQLSTEPNPKTGSTTKSADSRLLPCPQPGCKRQFKSTSTLGGHMKTHAGKGVRFPCSFPPCTEKFSRRHDQLRHEVYKHGKRCEWVCSKCNSFFSYERSLEKHTCTMDKSRRGSIPYPVNGASSIGCVSAAGR